MMNKNSDIKTIVDRSSKTTPIGIPWLQYAHYRRTFKERWPSIWCLKIATNPFTGLLKYIVRPKNILDIGATDKVWRGLIQHLWPGICYRSLDVDQTNKQDYYSFKSVDTKFDLVVCFEVLEHLKPTELLRIIEQCISVCKKGAYVEFSVPNLLSDSYWMDFTHQTALSFWDLPTLMSYCGLEIIEGWRWFTGTTKKRLIHRYPFYCLHRVINKDFCQSILMLGRKQ